MIFNVVYKQCISLHGHTKKELTKLSKFLINNRKFSKIKKSKKLVLIV